MLAPESFPLCHGCLSEDRRCNLINTSNSNIFLRILEDDSDCKTRQDIECLFLCWECNAILSKIKTFQLKVQKARDILNKHYLQKLESQCLSTLKTITKTKYDADITTSIQFKEITISKIVAAKKKEDFDISIIKEEVNFKESPRNYDFSDNDYDINDSDDKTDDKPTKDVKIKGRLPKNKLLENGFKKEEDSTDLPSDLDAVADRPRPGRIKKPVEKLGIPIKKKVPIKRNQAKIKKSDGSKEIVSVKDRKPASCDNKTKKEKPVRANKKDKVATKKINHYNQNSRYTKVQIDKDNILRYFTKYTLSVSEYRSFLQELAKTPYFMSERKKCAKCVVTFLNEEDYVQHMMLHDLNLGNFSCNLCDIHFLEEEQHHAHMTSHLTVQQCNICKQSCGLQHSLSVHMDDEHREGCFKCSYCDMLFVSRPAVNEHYVKIHRRLVCDDCGRAQKSKKTMAKHYRWQHMQPQCPHCRVKFSTYRSMRPHLIAQHNHPEMKKSKLEDMYCVECNKQFTIRHRFRAHVNKVHKPNKERFPCPECGKVFSRKHYLINHMKLFHGEGTEHRCDTCNKSFSSKYNLVLHTDRVHKKIPVPKNKVCETCGLGFETNRVLIHHMRTHTGERPHECSYCHASFAQKYARDEHVRKQHLKHLQQFVN